MYTRVIIILVLLLGSSCGKEFLEKKPNKNQVVPSSLSDLQALLNGDYSVFNGYGNLANIAADDYFKFDPDLLSLFAPQRNTYSWEKDMYGGVEVIDDWNNRYRTIFYCNVVLEGLEKLQPAPFEQVTYSNVKGTALFYRAMSMYNLLQAFSQPYDKAKAATTPGVPNRITADLNEIAQRAGQQECYDFVLQQLKEAAPLLPDNVPITFKPSKTAAYSMLCRTYLAMEDYTHAEEYADSCLSIRNTLIDYNTLNASLARPFPLGNAGANPEVLLYGSIGGGFGANVYVDTTLVALYDQHDLRKTCFFLPQGNYVAFKGSYTGNASPNGGPSTDEMYLVKAECLARKGAAGPAMDRLNSLLVKRFRTGYFIPLTATDAEDALRKVLIERRKEMVGRGTRWFDLRRLNKDSRFAVTLKRLRNGSIIELPPGDIRYTFPIPDQELRSSGLEQNPR